MIRHHTHRRQLLKMSNHKDTIERLGNPFSEDSGDLLILDSSDLVDPAVIDTARHIEKLGQDQYNMYVTEHRVNQTKHIYEPIKRNNLPLFSWPPAQHKSKGQQQLTSLKNDCSLFSRLYIASQIRDGDLSEFFQHENQACPPSPSQIGKLRTGVKITPGRLPERTRSFTNQCVCTSCRCYCS